MRIYSGLILILFACAPLAFAQTTAPTTTPAVAPAVDAIRAAKDPSAAVEAYARGVAADPGHLADLEQAYVHHMVALGAPEMADAQAHDLVGRNAADALTRGVAAYSDAGRGNAPAALANLKTALTEKPDDLFLLRTAGQIVAWYDGQSDRSNLSKDDVAAVEWLRSAGTGREEFANAYRAATEARRQSPAPASTQAAVTAPQVMAPTTYYYPTAEPYVAPYVSGYYDHYPYYAYWPSYSLLILRDRDCDRHQHRHWFNRDGFEGGRFDRSDRFGRRGFDRTTGIERGGSGLRTLDRVDGSVVPPLTPSPGTPRGFVGPLPVNAAGSRDGGAVRSAPPRQMGPQPTADRAPAAARGGSASDRGGGGGSRGEGASGGNRGSGGSAASSDGGRR